MLGLWGSERRGGRLDEGWGTGPRRASSLLRHQDADDLGVWSSLGALPLRPSRCSAALRAWAGRRWRSGAGLPSRGAATPRRPLPNRGTSALFSPPLPTPNPRRLSGPHPFPTPVTHCVPPPASQTRLSLARTPPPWKG